MGSPTEVVRPSDVPATRVRHVVLAGLCLAATIAYIQRNSLGVAESTIRDELVISKEAMGWIGSAFFASYALLQLPKATHDARTDGRSAIIVG